MWLTLPRLVGVLSPFPILIACASAGARDANVITAPELSRSKARNAYDAIQSDPPRNAPDPGPRHRRVLQGPPAPCRRGQHPRRRRRGATNPSHRQGGPDRIRQLLVGGQEIWDGIRERSDAHRNSGRFGTRIRSWVEQLPLRAKCIREELAARASRQAPTSAWGPAPSGPPQRAALNHPEVQFNWPSRIRTWINGSKVRCPAIGRRASNRSQRSREHCCQW